MPSADGKLPAGSHAVALPSDSDRPSADVWRRARQVVVLFVAALIVVSVAMPRVDGHRVRPGTTIEQALRARDVYDRYCGDQVDVTGQVVRRGGGDQPLATVRGRPVGVSHRMGWGERARASRGPDAREPVQEFVREQHSDADTTTTTRYVLGTISGKKADHERVNVAPAKVVRIGLTFDDGPFPDYTARVLKLLAQYHAHATFFVLGQCATGHPDLVRKELAAGHEVGIHSWTHPQYTGLSAGALSADLTRCNGLLTKLGAGHVRFVRPPYGTVNARVRSVIAGRGYHMSLWDVDTNDWRKPSAGTIASRIMHGADDGNVILMHDGGGDRSNTVAGVAMALPKLHARGVRMLTLSQLKGLEPAPPTELIVADETLGVRLSVARARVTVDGRVIDPPPQTARNAGQLLIGAGAVLRAAGIACTWDRQLHALRANTPAGEVVLRANSRRFTLAGQDMLATTPAFALEYEGELLAPVGLVARLIKTTYTVAADGSVAFTRGPGKAKAKAQGDTVPLKPPAGGTCSPRPPTRPQSGRSLAKRATRQRDDTSRAKG